MKTTTVNRMLSLLVATLLATMPLITANAADTEIDHYPSITIPLGLYNGATSETLSLNGEVTWEVYFPDVLGSAVDNDMNGLEDVPTKMTQLDLMGTSTIGLVTITLNAAMNSLGIIEEQENVTPNRLEVAPFEVGSADSFFDLFIELTLDGAVLHNNTALRISGPWSHKPPNPDELSAMFIEFTPVVLFDSVNQPTDYMLVEPDTDGDGISDSDEVVLGTDPTDSDSDDDGIVDGSDPDIIADVVTVLPVGVFANSGDPEGQRNAMLSRLANIEQDILDGDIDGAIRSLQNLRRKVDGCGVNADRNDWITDCSSQLEIRVLIDLLIMNLSS